MEVEQTYNIDELYEKVEDYDLVFRSEAALMSALNDRLEKPIIGHFAVTPLNYVLSDYQNQKLLQERGIFIETDKGEEYFFQKNIENEEINVGNEVKFETSEGDKGSEAKDIKPLK